MNNYKETTTNQSSSNRHIKRRKSRSNKQSDQFDLSSEKEQEKVEAQHEVTNAM